MTCFLFILFFSSTIITSQKLLKPTEFYIGHTTFPDMVSEPDGCYLEVGNTVTKTYREVISLQAKDNTVDTLLKCGSYLENMAVDTWGNILTYSVADDAVGSESRGLHVYRIYFRANHTAQLSEPIASMQIAMDGIVVSRNHFFIVGNNADSCTGKCVYQYNLNNDTLSTDYEIMDLQINLYYIDSAVSSKFYYILHTRDNYWMLSRWRMGSWEDTPMLKILEPYRSDNPKGKIYVRNDLVYLLLLDDLEYFMVAFNHKLDGDGDILWRNHTNLVGLHDIFTMDISHVWYAIVRNNSEGVYTAPLSLRHPAVEPTLDIPHSCQTSFSCDMQVLIPQIALVHTVKFSKYRDRSEFPSSVIWGLFVICAILLFIAVVRYIRRERSDSFFWGKSRLFTHVQDYDFQEQCEQPNFAVDSYHAPDLIEPVSENVNSDVTEEDLRKRDVMSLL